VGVERTRQIDALRQAIRRKHRCVAVHFRTVPVRLEFKGKVLWDGEVEEFHLSNCSAARKCYAWIRPNGGRARQVLISATETVNSPRKAVEKHVAEGNYEDSRMPGDLGTTS
jgi:hypothetical protein